MVKHKESTAKMVLGLLVHTAKEQYVLSGQGAEPVVGNLVKVIEALKDAGQVPAQRVKEAKAALEKWKEDESRVQLPENPAEEDIKTSICWLDTFLQDREEPSLQEANKFYKDYWNTVLKC